MNNTLRPTALLYPLALLLASTAITGCLFDNGSNDAPGIVGQEITSESYIVVGNTIITPEHDIPLRYCVFNGMVDTSFHQEADTVEFRISGDSLIVTEEKERTQSGAIIEWADIYKRIGEGKGLEGDWIGQGRHYLPVSGTLSAEDKDKMDRADSLQNWFASSMRITTRFAQGKVTTYVDLDYAKIFLAGWNGTFSESVPPDSARYDIQAKGIDKATVELLGRKTGETVRITETAESRIYTSTKVGHATHQYLSHPSSCPNEPEPAWFQQFMDGNRKDGFVLEKSAENGQKNGFAIRIPFVPLKTMHSLLN